MQGYKENGGSTDCILQEPVVTGLAVSGLIDIGNSLNGTQNNTLTVTIDDNNEVSHYYLTHVAPGDFTPTGITGDSNTEGTRSWSTTQPDSYELPTTDGPYTLHLWVANIEGTISGVTASDPFVLDTTTPNAVGVGATKPTQPKDTGAEAQFSAFSPTEASGGTVTLSYCVQPATADCSAAGAAYTAIGVADWPIKVDTTQVGDYEITFKFADKLGHTNFISYPWKKVECIAGKVDAPSFTDGVKTRTCGSR